MEHILSLCTSIRLTFLGGTMEKRIRDYIRHLEKLDLDVASEDEISRQRKYLRLRLDQIHQEMVRLLITMMAFLISSSIFVAAGLAVSSLPCYCAGGAMFLIFVLLFIRYRSKADIVSRLVGFLDKMTIIGS